MNNIYELKNYSRKEKEKAEPEVVFDLRPIIREMILRDLAECPAARARYEHNKRVLNQYKTQKGRSA